MDYYWLREDELQVYTTKLLNVTLTSCNMEQSDSNAPEIHCRPESFPHRLPEHGPLVHVRVEILLCPVQRHKLLVVLKFPRRPEVGQFVDDAAVVLDELHYVPRLEVSVHQIVVPQVVHPSREMREDKDELVLVEAVTVLRIIEEIEETSSGAKLHDNHLSPSLLLLLDRKELDNVFMLDFFENLKTIY